MEHTVNQIKLRGQLKQLPEFSHENHGRRFSRLYLDVPRLSGAVDTVPVIADEALLRDLPTVCGTTLAVTGQIRSHNIRSEGRRRLLIFVFAESIIIEDGEPVNEVILEGPLCKEPIYRRTPLGREICDVMLAVPRGYSRADYLPCILWGKVAKEVSVCQLRDTVRICGRMQSRAYTKVTEDGPQERIAYEISALTAQVLEDIEE